jgi:hypothetical protein
MNERRAIFKPCAAPGTATAEQGVVLLDGPEGVAVAMTADAAARTAESLLAAAALARETATQEATGTMPDDSIHG